MVVAGLNPAWCTLFWNQFNLIRSLVVRLSSLFFYTMKKRYQYYAKNGIEWTDWFEWDSNWKPKIQLKNRLFNEYEESIYPGN